LSDLTGSSQQAKFDTVSCSNFDAKARRSTGCPPPEARLQDFGKSHRQCQESHLKVEKMAKVAASSGNVFRTPPGGLSQIIASFCTMGLQWCNPCNAYLPMVIRQ